MQSDPFLILVLVLLVAALMLLVRLEQRARRSELRLQALLKHLEVPDALYPAPSDKVRELLAGPNGTVAAIKQYRADTGLGLKEASDAVTALKASASGGSGS